MLRSAIQSLISLFLVFTALKVIDAWLQSSQPKTKFLFVLATLIVLAGLTIRSELPPSAKLYILGAFPIIYIILITLFFEYDPGKLKDFLTITWTRGYTERDITGLFIFFSVSLNGLMVAGCYKLPRAFLVFLVFATESAIIFILLCVGKIQFVLDFKVFLPF